MNDRSTGNRSRNAKALAAALDERVFPVKFRAQGFTESHQIHLDEAAMKKSLHLSPQEFSTAMEANNLIVDAVARIGTNEVTRLGGDGDGDGGDREDHGEGGRGEGREGGGPHPPVSPQAVVCVPRHVAGY